MTIHTKKGARAPTHGLPSLGLRPTVEGADEEVEPGAGCCPPEFAQALDDFAFLDRQPDGLLAHHVMECPRCHEALRRSRMLYTAPPHLRARVLDAAGRGWIRRRWAALARAGAGWVRLLGRSPANEGNLAPRRRISFATFFAVAATIPLAFLLTLAMTGQTVDLTEQTRDAPRRAAPPAVTVIDAEPVVDRALRAAVEAEVRGRGLCTGDSAEAQARCARLAAELVMQARPVAESPQLRARTSHADAMRRVLQALAEPGPAVSPAVAPSTPSWMVREPLPEVGRVAVRTSIPTPPASTGDGMLSVHIVPSGEITIDGHDVGPAPRDFRLPAGRYRIGALRAGGGRSEAVLQVVAGEQTRWDVDLSKP